MVRIALILCAVVGGFFAVASKAGPDNPLVVRNIIVDGVEGSGFYSVVEQGYRFVEEQPTLISDLPDAASAEGGFAPVEAVAN